MVAAATTKMDEFGQECERKTLPDSNKVVVAVVTWSVQSPPPVFTVKTWIRERRKNKTEIRDKPKWGWGMQHKRGQLYIKLLHQLLR